MFCHIILKVWGDFKCTGSQIDWYTGNWYFTFILPGNTQRLQKLIYLHVFTDCFLSWIFLSNHQNKFTGNSIRGNMFVCVNVSDISTVKLTFSKTDGSTYFGTKYFRIKYFQKRQFAKFPHLYSHLTAHSYSCVMQNSLSEWDSLLVTVAEY